MNRIMGSSSKGSNHTSEKPKASATWNQAPSKLVISLVKWVIMLSRNILARVLSLLKRMRTASQSTTHPLATATIVLKRFKDRVRKIRRICLLMKNCNLIEILKMNE